MNQLYVSGPFVMLVEIVKQRLIVFFLSPSLSAEVSNTFFRVPPEYASGYIIITAVATFGVTLLIMLTAVIIIACVCYRHAQMKNKENFSDKKW